MAIRDALLPEFDHETAVTRRYLERVPDGRFDWKPHAKSTTLGYLANHISHLPSWTAVTLERDGIDVAGFTLPQYATRAELVAAFDANVAAARAVLARAEDATFAESWSLRSGDFVAFTLPKAAVMRSFVLNHLVHHRAQLGLYLRLLDVPVPATYGPSADEQP